MPGSSKIMKLKLRAVLLLIALLLIPAQSVFAASKLKRKDFTKMYGKYRVNFMSESEDEDSYFQYANMLGEKAAPQKVLKTYRGVALRDTKKKVIKKYGKGSFKKIKYRADNLYYALFEIDHDRSSYYLRKLYQYVDYYYYETAIDDDEGEDKEEAVDEYRIRFYFDKKGIVQMIAYFKNYDKL